MKRTHLLYFAAILIFIASGCKKHIADSMLFPSNESTFSLSNAAGDFSRTDKYVPHQLLVKFRSGLADKSRLLAFSRISGSIVERVVTATMKKQGDGEGFYLVKTPLEVFNAIKTIKSPDITYAEPNYIYRYDATSNDTYFTNGSLWGMYGDAIGLNPSNKYGSQAAEAWAAGHTGSPDIYVGVIDEGAMYTHPDLEANFWTNPFDQPNGRDDDGNGYVDDVHGWDFASNDNTTFDGLNDDHGTHVSGTIGASGGNGTGVVGVNWNVKIISAKFLGKNGGSTVNAIKALDYITDLKTIHKEELHIVATNNSWGGGGFSQALKDAIDRAGAADILFIAAAGNDASNNDATSNYPSNYTSSNVIAVASITSSGALSSFSNYGATTVDLGAPGSGIYSTVPLRSGSKTQPGYASYSGTSMATPHVTGAAALYASTHNGATAPEIKSAILGSALPTPSLASKTVTGGRLNVSGF